MSATDELRSLPEWQKLEALAQTHRTVQLRDAFAADPGRVPRFTRALGDMLFDFSKHRVDTEVMAALYALTQARELSRGIAELARGELVNNTEQRAAQHMALRAVNPVFVAGENVLPYVESTRQRLREIASSFRNGEMTGTRGGKLRHLVHIGIGGSDLGPRVAVRALASETPENTRVSFVANLDPTEIRAALHEAQPDETLFVVASKSFTTQETLANAQAARQWLAQSLGEGDLSAHFLAVTNNIDAARQLGIPEQRCIALPEWVGGRYSMWSAIGLPIACALGWERFEQLLAGAREADAHFVLAPPEQNIPVLMGLLGIWNANFLGCESQAVLPYVQRLADLPAYLQQLDMESNGKRVDRQGRSLDYTTAPILWGGTGTVGQHAYHQLLYQGTRQVAIDFIVAAGDDVPAQRMLVDNALAQSAALMRGRSEDEARAELEHKGVSPAEITRLAPHLVCPGNQPSSTFLFPELTPHALGRLIALYEHKVFVQGWIWGINSFDQYGVELGKQMARELAGGPEAIAALDASTQALAATVERMRRTRN
jgi:glucose-6-phosphate isomerase